MKAKTNLSIFQKAIVIFTTLFVWCSTFATAQNVSKGKVTTEELKNKEMTAKITRYEVKKEFQEKFQKAVSDYVLESLLNDSNIMSEAYFEQDNQNVIWLFERWANQKELDQFKSNSKSKAVIVLEKSALVKPAKVIFVTDLEPISKQEWRRTSKAEDNFKAVYHTAMPQFRSEPGVVTYQLSQLNDDKTQFVTFEKFRSNDAFQYHLNFPPIQPVIDYLNTSIKKQPFQDGIHNLIEFAPLTRE